MSKNTRVTLPPRKPVLRRIEDLSPQIVPSEFGDLSYYGLLRSMLNKFNEMIPYINYVFEDNEDFKNNIYQEFDTFTANITNRIDEFETSITNQQNSFETSMTNKQNSFENLITSEQEKFEVDITRIINDFKSSINKTVSDFTTDMTSKYNNLSEEFTSLETYVRNYLNSAEFIQQIKTAVEEYMTSQEFQTYVHDLVLQVVGDTAILSTGGTMSGNLVLNNNVNVSGKTTDGNALNLVTINTSNESVIGNKEYLTLINGSRTRPYYNSINNPLALVSDTTNKLALTGGTLSGSVALNNNVRLLGIKSDEKNCNLIGIATNNQILLGCNEVELFVFGLNTRPYYNNSDNFLALYSDTTNKLPLSGGTMTGSLILNNKVRLYSRDTNNSLISLIYINTSNITTIGDISTEIEIQSKYRPTLNSLNNIKDDNQIVINSDLKELLSLSGGTMTGNLVFADNNGVAFGDFGKLISMANGRLQIGSATSDIELTSTNIPTVTLPSGTETLAFKSDINPIFTKRTKLNVTTSSKLTDVIANVFYDMIDYPTHSIVTLGGSIFFKSNGVYDIDDIVIENLENILPNNNNFSYYNVGLLREIYNTANLTMYNGKYHINFNNQLNSSSTGYTLRLQIVIPYIK